MKSSRDQIQTHGSSSNMSLSSGYSSSCSSLSNGSGSCEMVRPTNWYQYQKSNHHIEYQPGVLESPPHLYYQAETRNNGHVQPHQAINQRFIQYVNNFPSNSRTSASNSSNNFSGNGFGFQYLVQPSYFGACDFRAPPPGFQHMPMTDRISSAYHCEADRSYQHSRFDWIRNEGDRPEKISSDYLEKKENEILPNQLITMGGGNKTRQAIYEAMIQNGCSTKDRLAPTLGEFNAMAVSVCHEIENVIAGGGPALEDMMDFCKAIQLFMVTPTANISHTMVLLREMILSFIHISSAYIHLSSILHMTDHPPYIANDLNSLKNICSRWEEMSAMVIMSLRSIINAVSHDSKIDLNQNNKNEDGSGDCKEMPHHSDTPVHGGYGFSEGFHRFGPPGYSRPFQRFDYTQNFDYKRKFSPNISSGNHIDLDPSNSNYNTSFPYLPSSYNSFSKNHSYIRNNKNFPPLQPHTPIPTVNTKWRKDQSASTSNEEGNISSPPEPEVILMRKATADKEKDEPSEAKEKMKEDEGENTMDSMSSLIEAVKEDLEKDAATRWNTLECSKKGYLKTNILIPFLLSSSIQEQKAVVAAAANALADKELKILNKNGSFSEDKDDSNKKYDFANSNYNKNFEEMTDSLRLELKHKMLDTLGFVQAVDLSHHEATKEDREVVQRCVTDELNDISYLVYSDHLKCLSDMLKQVRRVFLKSRPQHVEKISVLNMIEDVESNFLSLFRKEFGACNMLNA